MLVAHSRRIINDFMSATTLQAWLAVSGNSRHKFVRDLLSAVTSSRSRHWPKDYITPVSSVLIVSNASALLTRPGATTSDRAGAATASGQPTSAMREIVNPESRALDVCLADKTRLLAKLRNMSQPQFWAMRDDPTVLVISDKYDIPKDNLLATSKRRKAASGQVFLEDLGGPSGLARTMNGDGMSPVFITRTKCWPILEAWLEKDIFLGCRIGFIAAHYASLFSACVISLNKRVDSMSGTRSGVPNARESTDGSAASGGLDVPADHEHGLIEDELDGISESSISSGSGDFDNSAQDQFAAQKLK
ncbi:hypothetical protein HK105_200810 [Polyrhizophydium stewartii]|uniref:Uncharacterized protein n=1 Tax=Polyrhizophydium stewartii TaxID=2732419 RepID=A0ABR4NK38_9FUNG